MCRLSAALDELLPEAFATVREASRRVLGMRHFDSQLVGKQSRAGGGGGEGAAPIAHALAARMVSVTGELDSQSLWTALFCWKE